MELGSILDFFQDKKILITGACGFLAKILSEKILRVQPNVNKLYLLLRAPDAKSATDRLHNEIIAKDLFRVLKEELGTNFMPFISEKLIMVPGDISCEDLGLKDLLLKQEMYGEIDVIINLAANTNFDERYDISLGLNTFGVKHVIDFAKKCTKLKVLVHVSTAYVCGEGEGLITEKPYHLGDSINGVDGLDIDAEKKVVEDKLDEMRLLGAKEDEIKMVMKDLGINRAKLYGWPNTYVFTKAMGEMFVDQLKENLSVVIIRPAIVTSTFKEPFSGWVEGVRTIDSLALAYGKGKLTCFLGDPKAVVDVIPGDMVVNAILVAIVAHAKYPSPNDTNSIYHVGSSFTKPLTYTDLQDYGFRHFTSKPWINNEGKTIKVGKVRIFNNMESFQRFMFFRYMLLLMGLGLLNTLFCQYFQETYLTLKRKIEIVMRLVDLYKPYLFFMGIFDDMNTEGLRKALRKSGGETDLFYFDPGAIDWDDYFLNIHLPGVVKYIFK